jgi:hypothetical protein
MNSSRKSILIGLLLLVATTFTQAQVGVGTITPNASAQLDVSSTTKGFLPPRMTYAQRQSITTPPAGLLLWCSNCGTKGELQVYNGTEWTNMIGGEATNQPPTVASTTAASGIAKTSATSGGNITNDFGTTITARGVCWSTSQNPTTADSKTTESGTTGIFTSNITGLTAGTLYYVRAYATNAAGTSYGAQESFTSTNLGIGDSYQGGKIAYILVTGDPGYDANVRHGLIAAPSDQGTAAWGCGGVEGDDIESVLPSFTGATDEAIGTGKQNTIDIMNGCATAGIAARLCGDLVLGGYSDWYLPSRDELYQLYLNKDLIGGFTHDRYYWSSTQSSSNIWRAWMRYFGSDYQEELPKVGSAIVPNVRAVRSF